MFCLLHLDEFEYQVMYKKGQLTNHLSPFNDYVPTPKLFIMTITMTFPIFFSTQRMTITSMISNCTTWIITQLAFLATQEALNLNDPVFAPTESDDVVLSQLQKLFCTETCCSLNNEEVIAFEVDDGGIIIRTAEATSHIVVPDKLKERVL